MTDVALSFSAAALATSIGVLFAYLTTLWRERQERHRQAEQVEELAGAAISQQLTQHMRPPTIEEQRADLISEFEKILQKEGRRGYWIGLFQNIAFFVLGLLAPILIGRFLP